MSAFTFTAPILNDEDDRAERAAMSEEEKERYRAEIYGTNPDLVETEMVLRNGLQLMQRALKDIPLDEKVDYQLALEQVPGLVTSESPPLAFLRVTDFDAWAAAQRLVLYWSTRRKVFGTERFLLPITLDGAMVEDVQYLEKGIIMILPDDAHRRAVLFVDRMRCTKGVVPRDSAIRCLWYAMQAIAKQEHYQRRGYVGLMNYRGCDLYKHFDRIMTKKSVWITNCMPVRTRAVHICTGSGASVTRDLILPVLKHMVRMLRCVAQER